MKANRIAIRAFRERLGLSRPEVASRTNGVVSSRYWAYIEDGERDPRPARLRAVAEALGVPLAAIAQFSDEYSDEDAA
jgi:transcriptional regulator with XRE-family HTH domain